MFKNIKNWFKGLFCKPQENTYDMFTIFFEVLPAPTKPAKRKFKKKGKK